jgi:hypothetical protein
MSAHLLRQRNFPENHPNHYSLRRVLGNMKRRQANADSVFCRTDAPKMQY